MIDGVIRAAYPLPLSDYPDTAGASVVDIIAGRLQHVPFNGIATGIFTLAVIHTFFARQFIGWSHRVQHAADARARAAGRALRPSMPAEVLHLLGEVEVVFGLWVIVLLALMSAWFDWATAREYVATGVNFSEAIFVVVVMAIASTRPVIGAAEGVMRRLAVTGGGSPAAWWLALLSVGPVLGSFITEPAAMTICAVLLGRQFFARAPSTRLKYATLGLLFVNISIGGTLTHFAAPPVLMVARPWQWTTGMMAATFGWKAVIAILASNLAGLAAFRREFASMAATPATRDNDAPGDDRAGIPAPAWVAMVHLAFLAFVVVEAHYPVMCVGAFLLFLGFLEATSEHQAPLDLRSPLLVGLFLAGLVVHGGLQGWWIEPLLGGLPALPLFAGATALTAFNDNALVTYLATLVPGLSDGLKYAVVAGAVTGGGLTVIANAPNPAGQALLVRHFDGGISPAGLLAGALPPTILAAMAFWLL